jgi:hypothetical protein
MSLPFGNTNKNENMKTNVTLNIGLETAQGNPVELHQAIREIERAGVTILASGIVTGQWEGKAEQTLVIQGLAFDSPELSPRLYVVSRALSQHCIAVHWNGKGELIGDNPEGYTFNNDLFHFHAREEKTGAVKLKIDIRGDDCLSGTFKGSRQACATIKQVLDGLDAYGIYAPTINCEIVEKENARVETSKEKMALRVALDFIQEQRDNGLDVDFEFNIVSEALNS